MEPGGFLFKIGFNISTFSMSAKYYQLNKIFPETWN